MKLLVFSVYICRCVQLTDTRQTIKLYSIHIVTLHYDHITSETHIPMRNTDVLEGRFTKTETGCKICG